MGRKPRPKSELHAAKKRRQDAFLAAFEEAGTISAAAKACKMNRRLHHTWMAKDEEYVQKFCESQEVANDKLEDAARKRAIDGWEEPVFYNGEIVGSKPRYSDQLMGILLKGNLPHKYKERYEHSGDAQNPIEVNFDLTTLSDEELRSLNKLVSTS